MNLTTTNNIFIQSVLYFVTILPTVLLPLLFFLAIRVLIAIKVSRFARSTVT